MDKIIPIGNRVLIKPDVKETTTASGIVLPGAEDKNPDTGVIVAVGDGEAVKSITVGTKIFFTKFAGTEIKIENEKYLLMENSFLIAILG